MSTIGAGHREGADMSKLGKLGSPDLPRSGLLKVKRSVARVVYLDIHLEETQRDRT